jgi:hypothetical protein
MQYVWGASRTESRVPAYAPLRQRGCVHAMAGTSAMSDRRIRCTRSHFFVLLLDHQRIVEIETATRAPRADPMLDRTEDPWVKFAPRARLSRLS